MTLRILLPAIPWTRALLDGSVTVGGFDVAFVPSGPSDPAASARLRGHIEPELAGAEQVIPDYLVRLSQGAGQPLAALPIFLTRGMVHRKLVTRREGPSLDALAGRRVGMSRVLAATAVYLRGFLVDELGLQRERVTWLAAEPFTSDDALAREWLLLSSRLGVKAPELLTLLAGGQLDAVLYPGGGGGNWYTWLAASPQPSEGAASHYGDLEMLVAARPQLCFPVGDTTEMATSFARTGIYPLFHMLALQVEVAERSPDLDHALVEAFRLAARRTPDYLGPEARKLYEREIAVLGVDPNEPGLTTTARRSVNHVLDVLEAEGALLSRPTLEDVFLST